MTRIIRTYEEFAPNPLMLPPHKEEEEDSSKKVYFLKTLYESNRRDITATGNNINAICSRGYYMKIKHIDTKIDLIRHNEPCIILGAEKGSVVSGINIDEDSIIVNVRHDDSYYVFSVKEDYQITFVKPKVVISHHDPYGEEDWGSESE